MAIYSKKNLRKYNQNLRKKLGIIFVSVFSVFLVNLLFNIIPFFNSFFLGSVGLFTYPLFIGMIVLGILFILDKNIYVNGKTLTLYIFALFFLLCIVHVITTKKYVDLSYGEYLSSCYNSKYTAGGILTGIITYPLMFLTHYVGSIVSFIILLVVMITLLIDKYIGQKQYKLNTEEPVMEEEEVEEDNYYTEENTEETPKKSFGVDDDIFIADEEPEQKRTAKSILGLSKKYGETAFEHEELEENPATSFFKSNDFQPETMSSNKRPNFFFHDDELDEIPTTKPVEKKPVEKKDNPSKKKASEFLSATLGTYKPLDEDNDSDIYDPNLSLKSYDKSKSDYKAKNDLVNDTYKSLMSTHEEEEEESDNLFNFDSITIKPTRETPKPKKEFYGQVDMSRQIDKIAPKEKFPKPTKYNYPTTDLLKYYLPKDDNDEEEIQQKSHMLEATLESFKIPAKITSIAKGPAFTRYELQMPVGIPVKRVTSYVDDIAMSLESKGSIRMEIPIPGKNAFGVEVPNKSISTVSLRDVLESKNFQNCKSPLTYALGQDIANECRVGRLEKAPHLLVAGSTGSGKSVCLNSMLISWIFKASPDEVRLILIDPKQVEFTPYNGIPHLLIPKVITSTEQALCALSWSIDEMERRYSLFSKFAVRNIEEYNDTEEVKSRFAEKLPYIVVVVDELADLMSQSKKDFEEKIMRLTQKSRAAGIHLVIATQRPSVDVITGTIKNNLPSRIAFAVSSFADSKTILGESGAENLLGKGDMLFAPQDDPVPNRIQGAFLSNEEIKAVLDYVKDNNDAVFDSEIEDKMFNRNQNEGGFSAEAPTSEVFDPLLKDALRNFIKTNNASVSKLQRIFNIGFNRAGRIVDQMEAAGFVSPKDSKNNRVIFCSQQEFEERFGEDL